jgi:hypothetical protein
MKMMTDYCIGCLYCRPICKFWNYCTVHTKDIYSCQRSAMANWADKSWVPSPWYWHSWNVTLNRTVLCDSRQHYTTDWLCLLYVTILMGLLAVLHYCPQGTKQLLNVGTNICVGYTACPRVAP